MKHLTINCMFFAMAILIAIAASPIRLHAQDGVPDLSFGIDGKVITPIRAGYDAGYGVAIQPDRKIVVAGESQNGNSAYDYDMVLVRYQADGSLDQGFGNGGKVITSLGTGWDLSGSVVLQPDGRIVVAGQTLNGETYDFIVARFHTDGSPDNSFSNNGRVKIQVGSSHDYGWFCALQPNGKIVVVGPVRQGPDTEFGMIRLNANGTLDNNFGNGGKVITPLTNEDDFSWSCAFQPDGMIVVAGASTVNGQREFALARYHSNGTLDAGFGVNGKIITPISAVDDKGRSVAIQADGKIVLGGTGRTGAFDEFAVVRYNADGSLDSGFGGTGIVTNLLGTGGNELWAIAIQDDQKILAAGYAVNDTNGSDFAMVRYLSDGNLDPTFGTNGVALTPVGAGNDYGNNMILQGDSVIVMTGAAVSSTYDIAVVKFRNGLATSISPSSPEANGYLLSAYPNPFQTTTMIRFQIPQREWVSLKVYDSRGRELATLAREFLGAGSYERAFEAAQLERGLYLFRLQAGDVEMTRKALLIR